MYKSVANLVVIKRHKYFNYVGIVLPFSFGSNIMLLMDGDMPENQMLPLCTIMRTSRVINEANFGVFMLVTCIFR